jgi:hypothetical protein
VKLAIGVIAKAKVSISAARKLNLDRSSVRNWLLVNVGIVLWVKVSL